MGSPVFVGAIIVLAVNDHVLKATWPGLITGKLSDVAGVVMIAILLTAATRRAALGFAVTIAGFACLKTIPIVAVLAAPVLGGVTRTDPSDLLALVALAPLWRWVARAPAPRPGADRGPRLAVRVVAVSAAVLAMTATSCDEEGLTAVDVYPGGVLVADGHASVDGGRTWTKTSRAPDDTIDTVDGSCVDDGTCYVLDGPTVTAVNNDVSTVILTVDDGYESELPALEGVTCNVGPWQSVAAVDLDDGRHLVVSMGAHGALHRGPDERWEWVAVGRWGMPQSAASTEPFGFPIATTFDAGRDWAVWIGRVLVLLVPAGVVAFARPIGAVARKYRRNRSEAIGMTMVAGVLVFLSAVGVVVLAGDSDVAVLVLLVGGVALGVLAGVAVIALLIYYGRPPRRSHHPVLPPPSPHDRLG